VGADMGVVGEASGKDSVAICGSSLSLNKLRDSAGEDAEPIWGRDCCWSDGSGGGGGGGSSRRSEEPEIKASL
jgi:hypothetical protein